MGHDKAKRHSVLPPDHHSAAAPRLHWEHCPEICVRLLKNYFPN